MMTTTSRICVMVAFACATAPVTARAQVADFFKKTLPAGVSALTEASKPAPANVPSKEEQMTSSLKSSSLAENKVKSGDVAADRQCRKPEEKFNVFEKAVEFAGEEGKERLQKLIASDFKYEDISAQDKEMLKYIARTTVWVPVELEEKVVSTGGFFSSKGKGSTPLLEAQRARVETRANRIRSTLDFPGDIRVKLDPDLPDGAFAKFGGDIVVSPDFASRLGDYEPGGDFVLAHELSHVYKRHPMKKLQFDLISTSEGWKLARKLLARMTGNNSSTIFSDLADIPALYSAVKSTQLTFSKEQEFEADACTAVWLGRIGDDPRPAWKEFVTEYAAKDQQQTSYGSTHPPTELREKNYNLKVAELKKGSASADVASNAPADKSSKRDAAAGAATKKPKPK